MKAKYRFITGKMSSDEDEEFKDVLMEAIIDAGVHENFNGYFDKFIKILNENDITKPEYHNLWSYSYFMIILNSSTNSRAILKILVTHGFSPDIHLFGRTETPIIALYELYVRNSIINELYKYNILNK